MIPVRDARNAAMSKVIAASYKLERPAQGNDAKFFAAADQLDAASLSVFRFAHPRPGEPAERGDITRAYDRATRGVYLLKDLRRGSSEMTTPAEITTAIGQANEGRSALASVMNRLTGSADRMSPKMVEAGKLAYDRFEAATNTLFGK